MKPMPGGVFLVFLMQFVFYVFWFCFFVISSRSKGFVDFRDAFDYGIAALWVSSKLCLVPPPGERGVSPAGIARSLRSVFRAHKQGVAS
jgi:hypothetical protein